jgi:hypothetical protein
MLGTPVAPDKDKQGGPGPRDACMQQVPDFEILRTTHPVEVKLGGSLCAE